MAQLRYEISCQKHELVHRFYGGVSKKRCPECERDAQLNRIEAKLDELLTQNEKPARFNGCASNHSQLT